MRDRVAMLDVSELYRPEIEVRKGKEDHEYRRYTFNVGSVNIVHRHLEKL